jgi:hypothetical protein
MKTTRTSGPYDPPPTNENITGIKRLRKKLQLVAGVGSITIADLFSCLPITFATTGEMRILKLSAWASASANSLLTVVFPIGNGASPGDIQTWADEGTQGALRPAIHLTPNFMFRSSWIPNTVPLTIATFGGTATDLLVIDITVEYRSAAQSCPALVLAQSLLPSSYLYDEVDGSDPSCQNCRSTPCTCGHNIRGHQLDNIDGWCSRCRSYNCSCYRD